MINIDDDTVQTRFHSFYEFIFLFALLWNWLRTTGVIEKSVFFSGNDEDKPVCKGGWPSIMMNGISAASAHNVWIYRSDSEDMKSLDLEQSDQRITVGKFKTVQKKHGELIHVIFAILEKKGWG